MTLDGSLNSLKFQKHRPGYKIKENSLKFWVEDEKEFEGWELYVPSSYIQKIKKQGLIADVKKREYVNFDCKFLLSLFQSLNPALYKRKLR